MSSKSGSSAAGAPPVVALCGFSGVGKSLVQDLLRQRYGLEPADDGRPVRDAARALYGLSEWHVSTQEGKASFVEVAGVKVQVRRLLGDLAVFAEGQFGEGYLPWAALTRARQTYGGRRPPVFVFGSVRRNQGLGYQAAGGVVVEIRRPDIQGPAFAFDHYNRAITDAAIDNDQPGRDALMAKLAAVFDRWYVPLGRFDRLRAAVSAAWTAMWSPQRSRRHAAMQQAVDWCLAERLATERRHAALLAELQSLHQLCADLRSGGAPSFQARVTLWRQACFGPEISADRRERAHRFVEEALELAQAVGCSRDEALQLIDYVFDRPVGDLPQEIGGVMTTLAALCQAWGEEMDLAGEAELARIWSKIEQIRAKRAAKPPVSPLPA